MNGTLDRGREEDGALDDAARFGIELGHDDLHPEGRDGVWAENLDAVTAFFAVQTQWRTVAMADGRMITLGLDYQGVKAGLSLAGIEMTHSTWADLRVIEAGACAEMNRRRS